MLLAQQRVDGVRDCKAVTVAELKGQHPPGGRHRDVAAEAHGGGQLTGEQRSEHADSTDERCCDLEERHLENSLGGERETELQARGLKLGLEEEKTILEAHAKVHARQHPPRRWN